MAADYQITVGGFTIGEGTVYDIVDVDGLDGFAVRSSDRALPDGWGEIPGRDLPASRTVTIEVEMFPEDAPAFASAFVPAETIDGENVVGWKFPHVEELQAYGRVARCSRKRDQAGMSIAGYVVQLRLPDPRAYAASSSAVAMLSTTTGTEALDYATGSGADLAFDYAAGSGADLAFDYSGASGVGSFAATNAGNVRTFPTLAIYGGTNGWSRALLTNVTTGQTFEITGGGPGTGQWLVGDMYRAVGYLSGSPVVLGSSPAWADDAATRYAFWAQPREPFYLQPGPNELRLEILEGDATSVLALVTYRNAYLT